jgi:hypothetical protein
MATCWSRPRRMLRAMTVEVIVKTVEPTPTAMVAAAATWAEFSKMCGPMLDKVWSMSFSVIRPPRRRCRRARQCGVPSGPTGYQDREIA